MQWFITWWNEMGLISQVFLCAAVPATIVMLLQTILLMFGAGFGGGADADGDVDADFDDGDFDIDDAADGGDAEFDPGLRIFTVRGLVAFFAIGGWVGVVAVEAGIGTALSIVLALVAGIVALILSALFIKWALKMQDSGNIDIRNAIAHTGTVYIPIPSGRTSTGRVTLVLQGRYVEIDAVTDSEETLKTGTTVQITGVMNENCLVVRPTVNSNALKQ